MNADRFKTALESFVRGVFSRIDYLALYPARVVGQNGDGSLELRPDDARLPGMSQVPIRYGLPGVMAKVTPGARVLVGFEGGGEPSRPVATLWEANGVKPIQLDVDAATRVVVGLGLQPVALATSVLSAISTLQTELTAISTLLQVICAKPGPITPDGVSAATTCVGAIGAGAVAVSSATSTAASIKLFSE